MDARCYERAGRRDHRWPAVIPIAIALTGLVCGLRQADAQDAALLQRGRELYAAKKCAICHALEGKGGRVAGPLDDVGKRWKQDELFAFLKAPTKLHPRSAMPPTRGTDDEIATITALMMSKGAVPSVAAPEPSIYWGQQLFASKHCFHCHRIAGKGGRLGPALDDDAVAKMGRAFLVQHFQNPASALPRYAMPQIDVSGPEQQSLIFFIESLKQGQSLPAIVMPSPGEGDGQPTVIEGEALYHAAACYNCHAIGDRGTHVGPALDAFGLSGRKPDWLMKHLVKPDEVAPGTTMPVVQGTERQLKSLSLFLFAQKASTQPTAALGRQVFSQQNCGYCHGADGKSGRVGPNLVELKQPRSDAWILDHLQNPTAAVPNTTMPRIWAADWELQSLLEYLKSIRR